MELPGGCPRLVTPSLRLPWGKVVGYSTPEVAATLFVGNQTCWFPAQLRKDSPLSQASSWCCALYLFSSVHQFWGPYPLAAPGCTLIHAGLVRLTAQEVTSHKDSCPSVSESSASVDSIQ